MKTTGNTGVALQGMAKYCLNAFVAITENETFLLNYGMFEKMKFCGGFITSIVMGTTCNEGPLHTTDLRQIYLY